MSCLLLRDTRIRVGRAQGILAGPTARPGHAEAGQAPNPSDLCQRVAVRVGVVPSSYVQDGEAGRLPASTWGQTASGSPLGRTAQGRRGPAIGTGPRRRRPV